jgi:hypothetical protein
MTRPLPTILCAIALFGGCSKKASEEQPREAPRKAVPKGRLGKYILDAPPKIPNPLDYEYGSKVVLLGYKLDSGAPLRQGSKVKLTLYWHLKEKLQGNWKLSSHVLDGMGEMVVDLYDKSPLRAGPRGRPALRPSRWQAGKYYVDELTFTLPPHLTADQVRVVAGVYSTETERMTVTKGSKDSNERVTVGTFDVALEGPSKAARLPRTSVDKLEPNVTITIDGKLDEPAWETATRLAPFVDVKTGDKPGVGAPSGRARMLWGEPGFYIAYETDDKDVLGGLAAGAKDPPLAGKDAVGMLLDPDGDGDDRNVYEIRINPQNLIFDASLDQIDPKRASGQATRAGWSSGVSSAVTVNGTIDKSDDADKGYVVEALIPWKGLSKAKQTPPALGDIWRMNLFVTDKGESVGWAAPLEQGNVYLTSRFGKVRFQAKGWSSPAPPSSARAIPSSSAPGVQSARPPSAPPAKAAPAQTPPVPSG